MFCIEVSVNFTEQGMYQKKIMTKRIPRMKNVANIPRTMLANILWGHTDG